MLFTYIVHKIFNSFCKNSMTFEKKEFNEREKVCNAIILLVKRRIFCSFNSALLSYLIRVEFKLLCPNGRTVYRFGKCKTEYTYKC